MKFPFKQTIQYKTVALLLFVTFTFSSTNAQSNLESIVRDILNLDQPEQYLNNYMEPFSTAFGSIVAGTIYHRAGGKEFPGIDVGLVYHYMKIPEAARTFADAAGRQPTVFGEKIPGSSGIPGTGNNELLIPQLQLNIGLFSGFEMMLRGSNYHINDIGEMSLRGFGVKYGLSDLLPETRVPLDMSVQVVYLTYGIDKWLNSGSFAMNLQLSANLMSSALKIFGGVGYESSSLKISTQKITDIGDAAIGDVSILGENRFRVTLGTNLKILFLNTHIEYNLGKYNSASAGLMLGF